MECVALDSPPSPSLQGQGLPAGLLPALPHATRVAPQLRCEFGHVEKEMEEASLPVSLDRGRWRWKQLASSSLWAQQSTARGYRQAQAAAGLCGTRGSEEATQSQKAGCVCLWPHCRLPGTDVGCAAEQTIQRLRHSLSERLWKADASLLLSRHAHGTAPVEGVQLGCLNYRGTCPGQCPWFC